MSLQDMTDAELKIHRIERVFEWTKLNRRIDSAKANPHKRESRQLETKRSFVNDAIRAIGAELERRGIKLGSDEDAT